MTSNQVDEEPLCRMPARFRGKDRMLSPKFYIWDYDVDPAEIEEVLAGRRNSAGPFDRGKLLVRLLERLSWYELLEMFGSEGIKEILTPQIINKLRFPFMRHKYEFIRKVLHGEPVSFTGWSDESRARVKTTILSNRWHRSQQALL